MVLSIDIVHTYFGTGHTWLTHHDAVHKHFDKVNTHFYIVHALFTRYNTL